MVKFSQQQSQTFLGRTERLKQQGEIAKAESEKALFKQKIAGSTEKLYTDTAQSPLTADEYRRRYESLDPQVRDFYMTPSEFAQKYGQELSERQSSLNQLKSYQAEYNEWELVKFFKRHNIFPPSGTSSSVREKWESIEQAELKQQNAQERIQEIEARNKQKSSIDFEFKTTAEELIKASEKSPELQERLLGRNIAYFYESPEQKKALSKKAQMFLSEEKYGRIDSPEKLKVYADRSPYQLEEEITKQGLQIVEARKQPPIIPKYRLRDIPVRFKEAMPTLGKPKSLLQNMQNRLSNVVAVSNFAVDEATLFLSSTPFEQAPLMFAKRKGVKSVVSETGDIIQLEKEIPFETAYGKDIAKTREEARQKTLSFAPYFIKTSLIVATPPSVSSSILLTENLEALGTPTGRKRISAETRLMSEETGIDERKLLGVNIAGRVLFMGLGLQGMQNSIRQAQSIALSEARSKYKIGKISKVSKGIYQAGIEEKRILNTFIKNRPMVSTTKSIFTISKADGYYNLIGGKGYSKIKKPSSILGLGKYIISKDVFKFDGTGIDTKAYKIFKSLGKSRGEVKVKGSKGFIAEQQIKTKAFKGDITISSAITDKEFERRIFGSLLLKQKGNKGIVASGRVTKIREVPKDTFFFIPKEAKVSLRGRLDYKKLNLIKVERLKGIKAKRYFNSLRGDIEQNILDEIRKSDLKRLIPKSKKAQVGKITLNMKSGKQSGYLDYGLTKKDKVNINFMESFEKQGSGIGTKLVNKLQQKFPNKYIEAISTRDASGFYEKTGWNLVKTKNFESVKGGAIDYWTKSPLKKTISSPRDVFLTGLSEELAQSSMERLIPKNYFKFGLYTPSAEKSSELTEYKPRQILKEKILLKNKALEKVLQKTANPQRTTQSQSQRTGSLEKLKYELIEKNLIQPPIIKQPEIFKTPKVFPPIPPFVFDIDLFGNKVKKGKRGKKETELASISDFTSKILGFKPRKIKRTDIEKEVRKIMTGLEIRRGAVWK